MGADYKYYEIDVADIKKYEYTCILLGKTSEVLGLKILEKIEAIIFNKKKPVFGLKEYKSDDKYYRDYKKRHENVLDDVVERFNLNFFFIDGDCFDYDENIIIDNTFINFDFWFVLKLRQYEFRLSEIKNFLKFHLETNFDNSIDEFVDFLKSSILKHQTELLETEIIETVNEIIENKFDNKLILKINYNRMELFETLKPYFDVKDHDNLNTILNEETIKGKICFKSNANQFVMTFRQLHLNQKIIGQLANTKKWICQYFTYYGQNKKLSNFDIDNVHKILTKQSYDIPKSKRIDLPELKYISDKSK